MGNIGGVSLASFRAMLNIPSIAPNSGMKDPLKMFHCVTWAMFSYLVTQAQVFMSRGWQLVWRLPPGGYSCEWCI